MSGRSSNVRVGPFYDWGLHFYAAVVILGITACDELHKTLPSLWNDRNATLSDRGWLCVRCVLRDKATITWHTKYHASPSIRLVQQNNAKGDWVMIVVEALYFLRLMEHSRKAGRGHSCDHQSSIRAIERRWGTTRQFFDVSQYRYLIKVICTSSFRQDLDFFLFYIHGWNSNDMVNLIRTIYCVCGNDSLCRL